MQFSHSINFSLASCANTCSKVVTHKLKVDWANTNAAHDSVNNTSNNPVQRNSSINYIGGYIITVSCFIHLFFVVLESFFLFFFILLGQGFPTCCAAPPRGRRWRFRGWEMAFQEVWQSPNEKHNSVYFTKIFSNCSIYICISCKCDIIFVEDTTLITYFLGVSKIFFRS